MSNVVEYNLITNHKSPNFAKDRINLDHPVKGNIECIVLHYTAQATVEQTVLEFELPFPGVSSHYVVGSNRDVYQMVEEKDAAYHAGISYWRGKTGLNFTSIGIEQTNLDGNLHAYTEEQIESVIALCKNILSRYTIPAINIVAHSDIAPNRKIDPGFLFPWDRLAANGIGAYPKQELVDSYLNKLQGDFKFLFKTEFIDKGLILYGYAPTVSNVSYEQRAVAFNRHFCKNANPVIDELGLAKLLALIEEYISLSQLNSFIEDCKKV